jgi:hypothetical protein
MTRFYLAARYSQQEEMKGVRDILKALGHEVTSRWIDQAQEIVPDNFSDQGDDWRAAGRHAVMDLDDVAACDVLLLFTRELSTTGGYHTELGFALARSKPVQLIGPARSIFMKHPNVVQYRDWGHFLISMQSVKNVAAGRAPSDDGTARAR